MNLRHVVVTSVNRDELPDGGAAHFARTIHAIREALPDVVIEVLTPDFKGDRDAIRTVTEARPDYFNHNVETVPRLYRTVRPGARFDRSTGLLRLVRELDPSVTTKSGLMVGLGETFDEVVEALRMLRDASVRIVTIGQYLRPSLKNLPVVEYVHPDVFEEYRRIGEDELRFDAVFSGPFVRSSYMADEVAGRVPSVKY
jgi:lipoyl synthase